MTKAVHDRLQPSDVMARGHYYSRKNTGKETHAAHLNTRTRRSSVTMLRSNALLQKRRKMMKEKKNNHSHIHFSSTEGTAGGRSCVCQTPERDTIDGRQGEGRPVRVETWRRGVPSCFILPEKTANNGEVQCTGGGNCSDRALFGGKMELNICSSILDLSLSSPLTWGLPGAPVSP